MLKNEFLVGVLSYNNVETIATCLKSIPSDVSILVLDSNSTDGSVPIIKTYPNAQLISYDEPVFNISNFRNKIIEIAQSSGFKFVFFLDSDETYPFDELCIGDLFHDDSVVCYMIPHITYMYGKPVGSAGKSNYHPRLIRVGSGRFEGRNLERYIATGKVECIKKQIPHYTNSKGIRNWVHKNSRAAEDYALNLFTPTKGLSIKTKLAFWCRRNLGFGMVFVRFAYHYFVLGGIAEGRRGFIVAANYGIFEYMVQQYLYETRRAQSGFPL